MEDLKTGVSITDLGLNDFRMDLLNYVKTNGDLANVPNGMHAVVPAGPNVACRRASSSRCATATTRVNINQQNRLHPYYLIYIAGDGAGHRQPHRGQSTCSTSPAPPARDGRAHSGGLPALQPGDRRRPRNEGSIPTCWTRRSASSYVKEEKDLDSLFTGADQCTGQPHCRAGRLRAAVVYRGAGTTTMNDSQRTKL